jgi:hypothetical protein
VAKSLELSFVLSTGEPSVLLAILLWELFRREYDENSIDGGGGGARLSICVLCVSDDDEDAP